jgi:arsenate reductase (thioredoxin)
MVMNKKTSEQMAKKKVLILCKHNSARSQMAEGLLKTFYGDFYNVYSAGTDHNTLNPYAVKVMAKKGVDISCNRSQSLDEFRGWEFDYVVTVCGRDEGNCPYFPGGKIYIHKSFQDPNSVEGDEEEKLDVFRRIREEIEDWIKDNFSVGI